jgi:sugar-specific transcriptional regulator TrmB
MESKITTILQEYGLDDKEVKVYISLVEKGELNAYTLAKITGIHRSTTYAILERLSAKGFISEIQKDGKTFYSAIEISKIAYKIKEKESLLLSLIPEFERIKEEGISRVRVFESKESQKQFSFNLFNQISSGNMKELYILSGGPSKEITPEKKGEEKLTSKLFMERLLKELKKQKTKVEYKGIWNEKFKGSELLGLFSGLGENRFLKEIPTLATLVIYSEYIAYLFTINETPQVIEIQNRLIAEENRAYFSYLWKIASK